MRIGIITGEYPPQQGGVGAYTHILAHELVQQEQSVVLLAAQSAQDDHLSITYVRNWSPTCLRAIQKWVRTQQPDIINIQYQTAAFGMSPFIHFIPDIVRTLPVVTTFHDLRYPYLFPKAGPLRPWIVNRLARSSAGNIVTNQEDAQQIADLPHRLIPIGSNIRGTLATDYTRDTWRHRAGATSDDYLLAYFGLVNRSKGLDHLITSLNDLRAQGIPARLLIIGGTAGSSDPTNAAYIQEINDLIERYGLADFIHWTGFIADETEVGSYLRAADIVALPFVDGASYRRGSLMAAIQYGCAIVTTTPQTPVAAFRDGMNMTLVPAGETQALTAALARLYATPEAQQVLRTGATRLRQFFDWSQIAADTIDYFQQILRRSH